MFVFSNGTVLCLMARRNSSILEAPLGPFPTLICFHGATGMHLLNQHTLHSMSASVSSFHVRFLLTSRHRAVRVAPTLHDDALARLTSFSSAMPGHPAMPCHCHKRRHWPRKRSFENSTLLANKLANSTASSSGNSTTNGDRFAMRLDALGGTVTMDVGPLSAFTQTTVSK